jgi:hypothetical protein
MGRNTHDSTNVKALTFDVFGTVVDYRGTIIREGELFNQTKGLQVDLVQFADAWRARYRPSLARVTQGVLPWINLDALHRLALDELLSAFQINDRFTKTRKSPSTVCGTSFSSGLIPFQDSHTCGNALSRRPSRTGIWPCS